MKFKIKVYILKTGLQKEKGDISLNTLKHFGREGQRLLHKYIQIQYCPSGMKSVI